MSERIGRCLLAGCPLSFARFVQSFHIIALSAKAEIVLKAKIRALLTKRGFARSWSWDSWRMWFKNRLAEIEALHYRPPIDSGSGSYSFDKLATATLHIFFIHLEETEAMLLRLPEDKSKAQSEVARSKIFKSHGRVPRPIDEVAARVAPDEGL